jgi:hypothetical protein
MTKRSRATFTCLLFLFAGTLHAAPKRARQRKHGDATHLISAGAYANLGGTTAPQPTGRQAGIAGQIGIFAEFASHDLRPGIDARLAGQSFLQLFRAFPDGGGDDGTATEKLIGPRLSYASGMAHPYVEALFGKGYESNIPRSVYDPNNYTNIYANGLARYAVAGVDLDADTRLQFRFEYAVGTIGGPQGFLIQNVTAGLVFRFP